MELKLMVVAHKKDFGSTLSFSKNVSYDEKELLKSVKYTNYSPHEDQIFEIEVDKHYLYFVTFIGGHDEYGREYQNVISAIMPFKLKSDDLYELRQSFEILKEEINSDHFTLNKKIYSRITSRKYKKEENVNVKFNPKKLMRNLIVSFIFLVFIAFTAFHIFEDSVFIIELKDKLSFRKEEDNLKIIERYAEFKKIFESEKDELQKYRLYVEFLEREKNYAKKYLEDADDEYFKKIEKLNIDDYYESEKNLKEINAYLDIKEFQKNRGKVQGYKDKIIRKFDRDAYKKIEARILKYNNNINYDDLSKLMDECEQYLDEMKKGNYRTSVARILKKAEEAKRGKSLELEIYVVDKSYVFNNKDVEVKIYNMKTDDNSYRKRKKLSTNRDVYIGSFYNFLKLSDRFKIDVSIYRSGDRKEDLDSFEISFSDLNKLIKVNNKNGNGFKLEIKVDTDVFKIKY